ncbi:hypothetical protein M9979_15180 [Sphingomonas sp. RP10(2022)]|uniref:Uncharacterized protein n=1 Tax=Sphingomonas liriopis TaxID=2949094 RepID=A0A9X2KRN5_9SPHN|nr:hypothetical protein [Sphingomonas liriopis]MCP3736210.1 hypothetical protein [Sphingomonas liriopis]
MIAFALAVMMLPAAQATEAPPPPPPADKRICRREVPLGSIMPTRICHTKAEWAAIDAANSDAAENARRANSARNGAIPNR